MTTSQIELASVDEADSVREVAATPDDELADTMSGELRDEILHEIFDRMREHFEPEHAEGIDGVVEWRICDPDGDGDGDGDLYQMIIRDGECQIRECDEEEASVTLTVDPVSFLKLVSGNARGPALMLRGKLKPDGDIAFARHLEGLFSFPQPED